MSRRELTSQRRVLLVLNCFLILVLLVFIWGNSFLDRNTSSQASGYVMKILTPLLEWFVGSGNVTEHLVRKLAHFTEFFVLGFLTICLSSLSKRTRYVHLIVASFFGLFCATIDEGIQIFSDRSNQWSDVALDFCGYIVGAFIFWLIYSFVSRIFHFSERASTS